MDSPFPNITNKVDTVVKRDMGNTTVKGDGTMVTVYKFGFLP